MLCAHLPHRCMTVSFHLYRPQYFFPGTGAVEEVGEYQASTDPNSQAPLRTCMTARPRPHAPMPP